jgi:hypothetical protein
MSIKTIRKTVYVTSDGKSWDDKDKARHEELVLTLKNEIARVLLRHEDPEEVARALVSPESPVIIVTKTVREPRS